MTPDEPENRPRIVVEVDAELEVLIPSFLAKRRAEMDDLRAAAEAGDFEALRQAGHKLKGTGGGFGFEELTSLGSALESHARDGAAADCREIVARIGDYLDRVDVVYV